MRKSGLSSAQLSSAQLSSTSISRPALHSILLPARRREQLQRCVGLIAKRRRIISIICGGLWRLNWKLRARRYSTVKSRLTKVALEAAARAVEDRGAGETPVFSLLRRGGRVYTKIIPDVSSATMFPVVVQKNVPDSIVYTDDWRRPVWAWMPNISNA